MSRPKEEQPTAGELEVLKVIWRRGPSTVREVLEALQEARPRAYTSVMSLMNVMAEKGLLLRRELGRAFVYEPAVAKEETEANMLGDLLGRVFDGSSDLLIARLLDNSRPSAEELDAIQRAIAQYQEQAEPQVPPADRKSTSRGKDKRP